MRKEDIRKAAREARLKKFFNLSIEDYERILKYQGGKCYICGRAPQNLRLSVDHCHATGLVRGLVCMSCNKGLAYFRDMRYRLYRAYEYLGAPPAVIVLGNRYGVLGKAKHKKKLVYGAAIN